MKLKDKICRLREYFLHGVWKEPRNTLKVKIFKTANLSMSAFLSRDLRAKAMALTYSTILAIVPALALFFAIARGFGFQNFLQDELHAKFPEQQEMLDEGMTYIDSYLSQASQGIFVGIGLVMLLWTVISVLSNVEKVFNSIWEIKRGRSMYQKITDYIAICLLVPVLAVCSTGISIFMTTMVQGDTPLAVLSPVVDTILGISPFILTWAAVTLSYYLIPNTKVDFRCAAIAGALATIGVEVVLALFVNGQIYVSKYNAIYGSFALLPLMLIWLQLSWLILLSGGVLAHSMQNIFRYNYPGDVSSVSHRYIDRVALVMTAIVIQRFEAGETPFSRAEISNLYNLPVSILSRVIDKLQAARMIYIVQSDRGEATGIVPAVNGSTCTVGQFMDAMDCAGDDNFIPYFASVFSKAIRAAAPAERHTGSPSADTLLRDLPLPTPEQVRSIINKPGLAPFPEDNR